ncbi:hypothetical protein CTEN210_06850 [Chaetoceros tenuissimus]|uniref:Uncharacterized protein n=1 Tax=Chaetoceros tenuissimus TaxID=426638 RepID=A0AAD3H579_9STRA|nr:hypothetical protein CTEN210_06850 [Chaetoceros tenuissimus]
MFSTAQFLAAITASIIAGSISCASSAALIFCILVYSQLKLKSVIRRILFGFCIYDLVFSFSTVLSVSMLPKEVNKYAAGNLFTCDVQGFMQQVGAVGSILYNGALSVYYLAVVTFNMKEKEIARKLEPWLHLIANGFAIGSGIFLAFKRQFAPLGNQIKCWVATYPMFCGRDNPDECVRGSPYTRLYANCLALLPSVITLS